MGNGDGMTVHKAADGPITAIVLEIDRDGKLFWAVYTRRGWKPNWLSHIFSPLIIKQGAYVTS